MPDQVGFALDVKERATVLSVEANSAAAKAGLQVGDKILRLNAQPILSIADVQWVLHAAPDASKLVAELDRRGKKVRATIIVAVDGQKLLRDESEFLAYLMQKTFSGQKVALTLVREAQRQTVELTMP